MNKAIIKLQNISKTYQNINNKITILKKINLTVNTGKLVALVGPSGSGKSTLLHLISLLDTPTSGTVFFKGKNLSKSLDTQKDEIRKNNVSVIYQQNNLLYDFNALENVMLPLIVKGKNWKNAKMEAKKLLTFVNLSKRFFHFPDQLSGGEQQRVAVARALIVDPDLILADEPTGSLDNKTAKEVFSLFLKLKSKKRTIIYATHNRELANRADYKLLLLDGNIKKLNE